MLAMLMVGSVTFLYGMAIIKLQKIEFDISCKSFYELSKPDFWREKKRNKFKMSSAENFTQHAKRYRSYAHVQLISKRKNF